MTLRLLSSACIGAMAFAASVAAYADVRVEGELPDALRNRIDAVLPDTDTPENRVQARRMARDAAIRIEALLRSEGYYAATVEPRAEGEEEFAAVVTIAPGPRFTVRSLTYDVAGDAEAQALAMPSPLEDPIIAVGDPLVADNVLTEEAAAVTRLRRAAYPDATPLPYRIVIDHATSDAEVTYHFEAGRPAQFGETHLETDARIRERWLRRLIPYEEGDPYTPVEMERLSGRLARTGAFSSTSVRLAPSQPGEGVERRDVLIELEEGDRHSIELGGGYGTSEGGRVEAEWSRRNMFGGAETLSLSAVVANLESRGRVQIRAPHFLKPNRTVIGFVEGVDENTDAYDRTAGVVGASAEELIADDLVAAVGVSGERSRVTDFSTGRRDFSIFTGFGELRLDRTDDLLDPHDGLRASLRLEPGVATGANEVTYARTIVNLSAYHQISDTPDIVLAGRVRLGTVFGAAATALPADKRFYAGGGGSVRGYAYQSLGPRDPQNDPLGGRSLMEMSAEARFRVTGRWGGVVFVDAGATQTSELPDFQDLSFGAGAGVRYYTNFGPIRADIATPLNRRAGDRSYQFYLSIGQAF